MKLTIGLTYDLKTDWTLGPNDPVDLNAELDSVKTIDFIAAALESGGHKIKRIGNVQHLLKQIDHLGVDIVLNIAEGRYNRNRESQVPMLLELKGIPYIGSDALTLGISLDKIATKKMMIADGIPTPRYFEAKTTGHLDQLNTIGFPLIVKTRYEGTSKGLTESSRVEDLAGFKKQVEIIHRQYRQSALVEEFIRGTEYTVPVLGNEKPEAMPIAQVCIDGSVNLGNQFFTFERVTSKNLTYQCPAKISDKLTRKLQDLAVAVYTCVECRDFGRVDFRVDEKGNPFALEINPLPSLAEVDVFNLFPAVVGLTYNRMILKILDFALARYNMDGSSKTEKKEKKIDRMQTVKAA